MNGLAPSAMPWLCATGGGSESTWTAKGLLPALKSRAIHASLVTLLIVLQYSLQLASALSHRPRVLLEVITGMYLWNGAYIFVGFAIIAVVQKWVSPGGARTVALIASALAWAGLWALWCLWHGYAYFIVVELGLVTPAGLLYDGAWTNVTYLLLAVWCYESADRARRSASLLRESELARQSAERWLLDVRLRSLQARFDPRVLFETLDEAGRLYRSRPNAAVQLLEALIDYLRRALPQLRQQESTLEREIELALAYLRILRPHEGEAVEVDPRVAPDAGDARFPPMVVQPVCDALARLALAEPGMARLTITASRDQDRARLFATAETVRSMPDGRRMADVRRILETMFAPLVRMETVLSGTGVASVLVEVPYVAAPRADR